MRNFPSYSLSRAKLSKAMSKITIKWIIIISLFIVALMLIAVGTHSTWFGRFVADMFSPVGFKDIAYNGSSKTNNGIWSAIAYALGILLFSGVVVAIITNHIRTAGERYIHGTVGSYPWRNHTLFIGYDELMTGTLKKACNESKQVVIAVPEKVISIRERLSRFLDADLLKKVEIVQCHQLDLRNLKNRSRIMHAKRIYIIGNNEEPSHDALNMKTLSLLARQWFNRQEKNFDDKVPIMMIYIRNQSTMSMLQQQGFKAEQLWPITASYLQQESQSEKGDYSKEQQFIDHYCEYFNFHCDRARSLLAEKDGFYACCHNLAHDDNRKKQVHLVVLGMTEMGVAIVREALHLAHPSGQYTKFLITMVDDNAFEEMHYFVGRTKELFKLCRYSFKNYANPSQNMQFSPELDILDIEFEFIQSDVAHPMLTNDIIKWATDANQILSLAICSNDSPKNMAVALYLPQELLHGPKRIPTWIYQIGDDSMNHLLDKNQFPYLHTFSLYEHAVEDTTISPYYQSARDIADYYNRHYNDYGYQEWTEMPQNDRWSSIYSVLSMDIKKTYVGAESWKSMSETDKRAIDRLEHNRWVVEKLTDGFRPTTKKQHAEVDDELQKAKEGLNWKEKDNDRKTVEKRRENVFTPLKKGKYPGFEGIKLHDDIRPYDELDEYTKEKDRLMLEGYIESIERNNIK